MLAREAPGPAASSGVALKLGKASVCVLGTTEPFRVTVGWGWGAVGSQGLLHAEDPGPLPPPSSRQ